jgi:tripartite-type tricarboxylate transporter receptor subunit TctC
MKRFLLAVLFMPVVALAQYPTKPVRMIIPFAPGGASDFVGRIMQPKMSELLGQQIVVENKPGAAGNIGAETAAKSTPDGYTLFLGNVGSVAINPGVYPKLSIVPTKDFIAVNQVVDVPSVLIIHPSLPVNSIREIVAYGKVNPGKLNYASPGSGSLDRLEMELLRKLANLDMVHVPYKGGATPREVVDRLFTVTQQVMKDADVIARLKTGGAEAITSASPAAFAKYVAAETERWARIAKEANATPD